MTTRFARDHAGIARETAPCEGGATAIDGVDGVVDEPESLVLQLLRGIRADIAGVDRKIDGVRAELKADLKSEMNSLRADFASDIARREANFARLEREMREQIAGLRRAVVEYHSSVIGHGILISELEARMRRVEQHLNLPALGSH